MFGFKSTTVRNSGYNKQSAAYQAQQRVDEIIARAAKEVNFHDKLDQICEDIVNRPIKVEIKLHGNWMIGGQDEV